MFNDENVQWSDCCFCHFGWFVPLISFLTWFTKSSKCISFSTLCQMYSDVFIVEAMVTPLLRICTCSIISNWKIHISQRDNFRKIARGKYTSVSFYVLNCWILFSPLIQSQLFHYQWNTQNYRFFRTHFSDFYLYLKSCSFPVPKHRWGVITNLLKKL